MTDIDNLIERLWDDRRLYHDDDSLLVRALARRAGIAADALDAYRNELRLAMEHDELIGELQRLLIVNQRLRAENDTYRKATGGLPPELVAKALAYARDRSYYEFTTDDPFDDDEITALRAATFEEPT